MKSKIKLLVIAGITLVSFSSCAVRIGGHARVPRERHERRGRGERGFTDPQNNGLQNSFASPFISPVPACM